MLAKLINYGLGSLIAFALLVAASPSRTRSQLLLWARKNTEYSAYIEASALEDANVKQ